MWVVVSLFLSPEAVWTLGFVLAIVPVTMLLVRGVRMILDLHERGLNGQRMLLARGKARHGLSYLVLCLICGWIGVRAMLGVQGGNGVIIVLVCIPLVIAVDAWMDVFDNYLVDKDSAKAIKHNRRSTDPKE